MRLEDVERNYDRLSRSYDFWNGLAFERLLGIESLRGSAVDRLGPIEGGRVLDIGCGTGLNFPHLISGVGPEGQVVGLDYSPGMLERARARAAEHGWRQIELVRGDAARLKGVGGPFDAVLSTWAMGIVEDLPTALERALSVLRPGGRLAILDFHGTRPKGGVHRLLNPLYHLALRVSGIDSPQDLDHARLQRRWRDGKQLLRRELMDVGEDAYLQETGFLLWGTKP